MRSVLLVATLTSLASAQQPPTLMVHRDSVRDFTTVASGITMNPTKCDTSGAVYFRAYQHSNPYGASIIKLDPRDKSALSIDISKVSDSSVTKPSTLKFTDFAVVGGTIYVPAVNEDENAYVLEFAAEDGAFQRAITLEDNFYPVKIGAFTSGAFVVIGSMKHRNDRTGAVTLSSDSVLYDVSGRIGKHLGAVDNEVAGGMSRTITPEDLSNLSLGLVESSGVAICFLQPSAKLLITMHESGTIDLHKLWRPGQDLVAINLRASGDNVLVEYVKDPTKDGRFTEFVLYDTSTNQPLTIHQLDANVGGAFGCYDWRNTYTFLTNTSGHRGFLTATVR